MLTHEKPLIYDVTGLGHRAGYVRTFSLTLDGTPLVAPLRASFLRLLSARRLVIPSFESSPVAYSFIVSLRVLMGRRTMLNLLRAHLQSHRAGWRKALHRFALWFFDRSRQVQVLSIVDDDLLRAKYPQLKFIVDPEFWDLAHLPVEQMDSEIAAAVRKARGKRKVLLVCGMIGTDKDLDVLRKLSECHPAFLDEVYIVIAGKLEAAVLGECVTLGNRGAFVEDRYLTDDEFISLFKTADFAWCCYSPTRDMSSGVFGRCLQLNVSPLIRKGSLLSRYQRDGLRCVEIDRENLHAAAAELLSIERPVRTKAVVNDGPSRYLRQTAHEFFHQLEN